MLMIRPPLARSSGGLPRDGHKGGFQVGADDNVKIIIIHPQNQAVFGDAGVVNQDIERPFFRQSFHGGCEGLGVADVADEWFDSAALSS